MTRAASCLAALLSALLFAPTARADEPKDDGDYYDVETVRNVPYRDDKDADPVKHKLDLYLPKGAKGFPVVVFVHGGAWRSGNKDLYGLLGAMFARNGVGTAVINYRLSPQVKHPAHAQDVARAFAWTHANIGKYGGRPDRMFLMGHSAGGHLVSLVATDPTYLKAEKLSIADVRGVIPMSGVYTILPSLGIFKSAFGSDEEICKAASPLTHVRGKHPPFLIVYADADFPTCDKMSEGLCSALKKCECEAETLCVKGRNHITIIVSAVKETDPVTEAAFKFIAKHADLKRKPEKK